MTSTVFETCNAVCRITLLLEPCVSLLQPSNLSNGCKEISSLPACVFVVKLCGNAGAAEPQHTNHCYRLSQCKGCGGQGSGRRPRHGGREEDGCLGVQSGEQGRMPHVWFIACRV